MKVCHLVDCSACPANDWHLCTSSWNTRWDGWTYTKEMLKGSGGLYPNNACGSSAAAAVRGQRLGRGDMAWTSMLPGVFPAEDELSTFSSTMWGKHQFRRGLGRRFPPPSGMPAPSCGKPPCGKVTQGRAIVFFSMFKRLDTCSSSFFHISIEMTLCLSGSFPSLQSPSSWGWAKGCSLVGHIWEQGSRKGTSSMWKSRACTGYCTSPVGQTAWKNGISRVVFCSLGYKPRVL